MRKAAIGETKSPALVVDEIPKNEVIVDTNPKMSFQTQLREVMEQLAQAFREGTIESSMETNTRRNNKRGSYTRTNSLVQAKLEGKSIETL